MRQVGGNIRARVPNACTHIKVKVRRRAVVRYVFSETILNRRTPVPSGLRNIGSCNVFASHWSFMEGVITPTIASKV